MPAIVLSYYAPKGSIIILEQPEIHLHPAVQAGLADVMIDAVKTCNIQIIFESHSEHLLKRLQRRIAEQKISPDTMALYFCESENDGSKLTPLNVDLFGNILNWPKEFFGDQFGGNGSYDQGSYGKEKGRRQMTAFVVDVNVAIVANQKASHADINCVLACVGILSEIRERGMVIIDDTMRILWEYMGYLRIAGQPGVGDLFMKWVWENQAVIERCEKVPLTPILGNPEEFAEFPADPKLNAFDRSDRKYVAVALGSRNHPTVLNAVDTDWWEHREALKRNGVRLRFLCPQHMKL